jgi:hypothetical protein
MRPPEPTAAGATESTDSAAATPLSSSELDEFRQTSSHAIPIASSVQALPGRPSQGLTELMKDVWVRAATRHRGRSTRGLESFAVPAVPTWRPSFVTGNRFA